MRSSFAKRGRRLGVTMAAMWVSGCGAAAPQLTWQRWEDLPDAVGRKGMYGGVSGDHVIVAGGSNFPVPQREGGRKTFHRDVFVRPLPLSAGASWRRAKFALPKAAGEGAAVTTEHGIVCVGGHDGSGPVADVILLRWNRTKGEVEQIPLPQLPEAAANAAVAAHEGWVYVAGGEGVGGTLATFWRLEVGAALQNPGAERWQGLPGWGEARPSPDGGNSERPGAVAVPGRFGCILSLVTTRSGPGILLAGGLPGPAKAQADYLRDVMLYDPAAKRWESRAAMPRGAVLGAVVPSPDGKRLLVLGGSDGHDFSRMKELGERYRIPNDVMMYDVVEDRWSVAGTMPLGLVGALVIPVGDGWLVTGGEYSPGLRTPRVYELKVAGR